MFKKVAILVLLLVLFAIAGGQFGYFNTPTLTINPYFLEAPDYEPQRNKYYYVYDINHPKMKKRDGTIKSRQEFLRELHRHLNLNCYFVNYEKIGLVSPSGLAYNRTINNLFRDKKGNLLKRPEIIKNFEIALIERGDIQPIDTLVANKDSTYYYGLRHQFFDKHTDETFTLKWGEIENGGSIPLENIKENVINSIAITDGMGQPLEIVQASVRLYQWKQVCGQLSFEKDYAPIMERGILSQAAAKKILNLNQAGESIIIQNVIVKRNGKLFEINERFKFVVKKPQLVT